MNQELETAGEKPDKDARTWAMICHLMGLSGYVIPFGNILGPLIIWAIKKDDHPFVDDQGREAMNFQLTLTIVFLACVPLVFILIGIPLMIALGIFALVVIIVAAIKANDGIPYRYPLSIKFFK
jgi:uncharacterized Tic20 family protein